MPRTIICQEIVYAVIFMYRWFSTEKETNAGYRSIFPELYWQYALLGQALVNHCSMSPSLVGSLAFGTCTSTSSENGSILPRVDSFNSERQGDVYRITLCNTDLEAATFCCLTAMKRGFLRSLTLNVLKYKLFMYRERILIVITEFLPKMWCKINVWLNVQYV